MNGILLWLIPVIATVLGSASSGFFSRLITKKQTKKEIAKLQAENTMLKTKVAELEKFKNDFTGPPLSLKDGIYFDESGNPYCGACFGGPHDRVPLHTLNRHGTWVLYECPRCKRSYQQGTFVSPPRKSWNPLD